ncbi:MAG: tetratricopeptide repeat protein [Candidatus Omnitrophica bacterium]|nr:tetratricopeptide repeat protein [Candidatus Omnitrophota bacterium]
MFNFNALRMGKKAINLILVIVLCLGPNFGYSQSAFISSLPKPGAVVGLSSAFVPVLLKGMVIYPNNPLRFDFIVDSGNTKFASDKIKQESSRLVKYFLAAMTVPQDNLWVNLSPYEANRIIPDELGKTELGRDMLAQDYILKQVTSSLLDPAKDLGKDFWDRVYKMAQERFGTTQIPVNTFNKVWIMPSEATVYENGNAVYITKSSLKVMLDQDYLALQKNRVSADQSVDQRIPAGGKDTASVSSQIIRQIILPQIEREVNEGKNFSSIRQIYQSLILAKWYKESIKKSLLSKVYVDQKKIKGVDLSDPTLKDQIYARYVSAFKKGVINLIKDDYDSASRQVVPRKYFSGGEVFGEIPIKRTGNPGSVNAAMVGDDYKLALRIAPEKNDSNSAMLVPATDYNFIAYTNEGPRAISSYIERNARMVIKGTLDINNPLTPTESVDMGLADIVNGSLHELQDLVKQSPELENYFSSLLTFTAVGYSKRFKNASFKVSDKLDIEIATLHSQSGEVSFVLSQNFMNLLSDLAKSDIKKAQLTLAVRIFHELGRPVITSFYGMYKQEFELMKQDLSLYKILKQQNLKVDANFPQIKQYLLEALENNPEIILDFDTLIKAIETLEIEAENIFAHKGSYKIGAKKTDDETEARNQRIDDAFMNADPDNRDSNPAKRLKKIDSIKGTFLEQYVEILVQRGITQGRESYLFLAQDQVTKVPFNQFKDPRVPPQSRDQSLSMPKESTRWGRQYYALHHGRRFSDGIGVTEAENGRGFQQKWHVHETTQEFTTSLSDDTRLRYGHKLMGDEKTRMDEVLQNRAGEKFVAKKNFDSFGGDIDQIWAALVSHNYIDINGKVQDDFVALKGTASAMNLPGFEDKKDQIFDILNKALEIQEFLNQGNEVRVKLDAKERTVLRVKDESDNLVDVIEDTDPQGIPVPFGHMIAMPKGTFHTLKNNSKERPSIDFTVKDPVTKILKTFSPPNEVQISKPQIIKPAEVVENWGEIYEHIYQGPYYSRLAINGYGEMQYYFDRKETITEGQYTTAKPELSWNDFVAKLTEKNWAEKAGPVQVLLKRDSIDKELSKIAEEFGSDFSKILPLLRQINPVPKMFDPLYMKLRFVKVNPKGNTEKDKTLFPVRSLYKDDKLQAIRFFPWPSEIPVNWHLDTNYKDIKATVRFYDQEHKIIDSLTTQVEGGDMVLIDNKKKGTDGREASYYSVENTSSESSLVFFVVEPSETIKKLLPYFNGDINQLNKQVEEWQDAYVEHGLLNADKTPKSKSDILAEAENGELAFVINADGSPLINEKTNAPTLRPLDLCEKEGIGFKKAILEGSDKAMLMAGYFENINPKKVARKSRAKAPVIDLAMSSNDEVNRLLEEGNKFIETEMYAHAQESYEKALKIEPSNPTIVGNLGVLYSMQGFNSKALEYLNAAVNIEPDSGEIWNNIGTVLEEMGENNKAQESYLNAVKFGIKTATTYYNLAGTYMEQHNGMEAEKYLRLALELSPDDLDVYGYLKNALIWQHKYDEALEIYLKIESLDPESLGAMGYNNIASLFIQKGNFGESQAFEKAGRYLLKAFELDPQDVFVLRNLGYVYQRLGRLSAAEDAYVKSINIDGSDKQIHQNLAEVRQKLKETPSDRAMLRDVSKSDVGGIDMNGINVKHQGSSADIKFDPVVVQDILKNGVDGFVPVIINLTPITSILPVLGLKEPMDKEAAATV